MNRRIPYILQTALLSLLVFIALMVLYLPQTDIYTEAAEKFERYMEESGNSAHGARESMRIGFIYGYLVVRESLTVFVLLGISILAAAGLVSLYHRLQRRHVKNFPLANPNDSLKNILSHVLLFSFGIFNRRAAEPLRYFFDRSARVKVLALLAYALIFFSISLVYDLPGDSPFLQRYRLVVLVWPLYPVSLITLAFFIKPLQRRSTRWLFWLSLSGLIVYFIISAALGAQIGVSGPGAAERAFEEFQILNVKDLFTTLLIALAFSFYIELMKSTIVDKSRMEAEIRVAQRIQSELIPEIAVRTEQYEIFGKADPAREVGGDLIDAVQLSGGKTAVAVADVSGHSVGSGLLMSMLKTAFRTELAYFRDPKTLAESLNRTIAGNKTRNMFISFLLGIVDTEEQVFSLVNCGHPPLLRVSSSDGAITQYRTGDPALGLLHAATFTVREIPCQPGDVFVLFSDGLAESAKSTGEEWGVGRLEETLREHRYASAQDIHNAILHAAGTFRGDMPQRDDVTLLVLRML